MDDRDVKVLPSVLDRLLDDDPDQPREPLPSASKLREILRAAIRRDVENFFNTRLRCTPIPEGLTSVKGSIVDFGVPDLVGRNFATLNRRRKFLRELEDLLRAAEPRFKSVHVLASDDDRTLDRTLHFRIEAVMYAEPAPEKISMDSELEPVLRTFQVRL